MTKLSDKEKAFVERAQREADAMAHTANYVDTTIGWDDAVLGAESAFPTTVIGWDNPNTETSDGPTAAGDKWAYVAAMIETERAEAHAARSRSRRKALAVVAGVAVIAVIVMLQAFIA